MGCKKLTLVFSVVFIILAISDLQKVEGIKCHECSTLIDGEKCGDPFQSGDEKENCQQCAKAKYDLGGTTVISRMCYSTKISSNGCDTATYQDKSADLCYCDTDLCNSSSRVSVSIATSLIGCLVFMAGKILLN